MRLTKAKRIVVLISATALAWTVYGNTEQERSKGDVPDDMAYAAKYLVQFGMDSPVLGTYQAATINYPDRQQMQMSETTIHGWVLPAKENGAQRILAWNGLSYNVVKLGESADLLADVKLERLVAPRGLFPFNNPEQTGIFNIRGHVASCLLAMLGEGDLAVEVSKRSGLGFPPNRDVKIGAIEEYDLAMQDAVVKRITLAEDAEAHRIAKKLKQLRKIKGSYPPYAGRLSFQKHTNDIYYVDIWLQETETRLAAGTVNAISLDEIIKLPLAEQIPLLIDQLVNEQIVFYNPATEEPPLTASWKLFQHGEDAIDTLIESLTDPRMTRQSDSRSNIGRSTRLRTVGEVCGGIVTGYWELSGFKQNGIYLDKDQIKKFWEDTRQMSREERWLFALLDDSMAESTRYAATRKLSEAESIGMRRATAENSDHSLPIGPVIQWKELYDNRKDDVVAALLQRSEEKLAKVVSGRDNMKTPDYSGASFYALAAAAWDVDESKPMLIRILTGGHKDFVKSDNDWRPNFDFSTVASALIYSGEDVWDIYEELLDKVSGKSNPSQFDSLLKPIWQHPLQPRSIQLAEKLFLNDGPWHARKSIARGIYRFSIFLYHPTYVESVREALADTGTESTMVRKDAKTIVGAIGGQTINYLDRNPATLQNIGDTLDIRYCDIVLEKFIYTFGIKGYDLFLAQNEKDELLVTLRSFFDDGADWSKIEENRRPRLRNRQQLFCTSPVWPDFSKKN